jgi:hypothetical protein
MQVALRKLLFERGDPPREVRKSAVICHGRHSTSLRNSYTSCGRTKMSSPQGERGTPAAVAERCPPDALPALVHRAGGKDRTGNRGRARAPLLDTPLPWTRMRAVYRLLGLVNKWGADRVEDACRRALEAEAVDVGLASATSSTCSSRCG